LEIAYVILLKPKPRGRSHILDRQPIIAQDQITNFNTLHSTIRNGDSQKTI